ncbi:hypothetical protein ACFYY5_29470 [Nocardia elegans]|uniref:Uncharacterized protein n=1 Tax=Nocardia elegans TaxID=300029 RepID=A0ABW6TLH4_9NOCA
MADDAEDQFCETIREFNELCNEMLTGISDIDSVIDDVLRPLYLDTADAYVRYRMGE